MGAHVVRPQVLVARVAAVDGLAHAERVREPVQPVPDVRADHQRVRSSSWLSSISLLRSPSSLLSPLYIRTLALHSSGVVLSHAQPGPAPLSSLHCSNVPGSFSAEGVQDRYTTPGILGVPLGAVSSLRSGPRSPFPVSHFPFRASRSQSPSVSIVCPFSKPRRVLSCYCSSTQASVRPRRWSLRSSRSRRRTSHIVAYHSMYKVQVQVSLLPGPVVVVVVDISMYYLYEYSLDSLASSHYFTFNSQLAACSSHAQDAWYTFVLVETVRIIIRY